MLTSFQGVTDYVLNKTVLFREKVAPVVSKMIMQMYRTDVLQVICTGWMRVGYNHELALALQTMKNSRGSLQVEKAPTTISVPSSQLSKHPHGEHAQVGGSRKKRKTHTNANVG